MSKSTRNRTAEHKARCAAPGPHQIRVYSADGSLSYIKECPDFDVIYRTVLADFQRSSDVISRMRMRSGMWPARWEHHIEVGGKWERLQ